MKPKILIAIPKKNESDFNDDLEMIGTDDAKIICPFCQKISEAEDSLEYDYTTQPPLLFCWKYCEGVKVYVITNAIIIKSMENLLQTKNLENGYLATMMLKTD